MILTFNIEYRTDWGEEVRVSGVIPGSLNQKESIALPLRTVDGIHWSGTLELSVLTGITIDYAYSIYKNGIPVRKEWNMIIRSMYIDNDNSRTYRIYDFWKNTPDQQPFYSSAFTESLLAHERILPSVKKYKKSLTIKAFCPGLGREYALAISGNQEILGHWDVDKVLLLSDYNNPEWQVILDASELVYPVEYKFVLYNLKKEKVESWELNPNRYLADLDITQNETVIISDRYVHFELPAWKGAGVAIPVFSLRSGNGFGVGDFGDLKKMVDWAVKTGQKIVQVLPVNDTTMTNTWTDSYPYNSISIYAFHPMYLDLNKLGKLIDEEKNNYFKQERDALNALSVIDYERVNKVKREYSGLLFEQEGKTLLASEAFTVFFEENKEWLIPYAVFCYLRDIYKTPDFRQWSKYSEFNRMEIEKFAKPGTKDYVGIAIYYYIQYALHCQLLEVSQYARIKGVVLKGDIPIGISRNSVEAWTEPHYFNLNGQAGAPPDDFSANGQNWGFPTYNWDVMEKDGYQWWMKRFQKMSEYFDAYRIDHILGFFRIWEIPMHSVHGLLGQFVPSLPMSREEIENFGLRFNEELFLKPYVHESFLQQLFGPHTQLVKNTFIRSAYNWEVYEMLPEFDTQRKVELYFKGRTDADSTWIRDGLYALISNVLFIRDREEPEKFHPRISVQHDFIYQTLSGSDKVAFNRLYDQYYYHRHNQFWYEQAMRKLPQLTRSNRMLVCGEDLGMIPDCVAWMMNELQILSLEIQRMPKKPSHEFGILNEYPYRSVCTISTHDMSTLRGWWKENIQQTQRYYNDILKHYGTAPLTADGRICEEIIRQHLQSNSMLAVLSFQDWLSMSETWRNPDVDAERINIPANPMHYWRYRIHLTLEELMEADSINEKIVSLIEQSGRNPGK